MSTDLYININKRFLSGIYKIFYFIFLFYFFGSTVSASELPNIKVPLIIQEVGGVSRVREPISSGVPFPVGILDEPLGIAVFDSNDAAIPVQFKVLERWRDYGHDESIKWLLVTFLADVPANSTATYYLKRGVNPTPITLPTADNINIFLEDIDFVLTKPGGFVYTQEDLIVIKTVEETGPVRSMVKLESPTDHNKFGFIAWIYYYAEIDRYDMTVVLKNTPRVMQGPFYFKDFSVVWNATGSDYRIGGEQGEVYSGVLGIGDNVYLYQDSSGTDNWEILNDHGNKRGVGAFVLNWGELNWKSTKEYKFGDRIGQPNNMAVYRCIQANGPNNGLAVEPPITPDWEEYWVLDKFKWEYGVPKFRGYKVIAKNEIGNGDQALGWIKLGNNGVSLRHFWQQFPKAAEVEKDKIIVRLWPKYWEGHDGLHWLDDVTRKAYDITFQKDMDKERAVAFNHPLVIHNGLAWYRQTGVIGYISQRFGQEDPNPENIGRWQYNWVNWGGDWLDRIRRRYHEHPMDDFIQSGDPYDAYRTFLSMRHSSGMTPMWLDSYSFPEDVGLFRAYTYTNPPRNQGTYLKNTFPHGYMVWNPEHWANSEIYDGYRLFGDPLAYEAAYQTGVYLQHYVEYRKTHLIGETRWDALPQNALAESYRITEHSGFYHSILEYLDIIWSTINKERGYYVPNIAHFKPSGMEKSFMISYLAEGLAHAYDLTGDERAKDMIVGIADYIMDESFIDASYTVLYETPIDPVMLYQQRDCAENKPKGTCKYEPLYWGEWRIGSALANAYYYTGVSKYVALFRDIQAGAPNNKPYTRWHGANEKMDYLVENVRSDTIPPGKVEDFSVVKSDEDGVILRWSAPRDAFKYQVKYSKKPIVENVDWRNNEDASNWWAVENVDGEPAPGDSGTDEEFIISNIQPGKYYFAIKSYDEHHNQSELSNVDTVTVDDYVPDTEGDINAND